MNKSKILFILIISFFNIPMLSFGSSFLAPPVGEGSEEIMLIPEKTTDLNSDDAQEQSKILLQKAKGPQWLKAYATYLKLAKKFPEVISDEWLDLIVSNWLVSSFPLAFEIFTELAKINPTLVITEKRVNNLVAVFAYPRVLPEAAGRGRRTIQMHDGYRISGNDYALEQFGELVKIEPGILSPERVLAIIASPFRIGIPDYHIREFAVPMFSEWIQNEEIKRNRNSEALDIIMDYIENPDLFDPFNIEFLEEKLGLDRKVPNFYRQKLLSSKSEDQGQSSLIKIEEPRGSVSIEDLKKFESALARNLSGNHWQLLEVLEVIEFASYQGYIELQMIMLRIVCHCRKSGGTDQDLEKINELSSAIDASFANNPILHTRASAALHRASLLIKDLLRIQQLGKPDELTEEEAGIVPKTPEGYLTKLALFYMGYRYDSKVKKWIQMYKDIPHLTGITTMLPPQRPDRRILTAD